MAKLDILRGTASRSREGLKVWAPVLALTLVGFFVTMRFVGPAPPDRIVIATGSAGGAYQEFGSRFAMALLEAGIGTVEVKSSAGSMENVELLRSGEADFAFVQSGVVSEEAKPELKGIASLYFEPLWVFCRTDLELGDLSDLRGGRVQIGAPGSGTRAIASRLLEANGVQASDADGTRFFELETGDAVDALLEGRLDALFLVISPDSAAVAKLMAGEGAVVRLFGIDRHLAYERIFPSLSHVVLPEGALDFERDVPDRDVDLVAPAATLLARADMHPAIVPLILQAAEEIHGGGTVLSAPGRFPSPRNLDVPLAKSAKTYFEHGRSFLYRLLPFRLAATIDRLKILLLPLLTLLFPLFKLVPPIYRWRIRSQIYRWYQALDRVERRFEDAHETNDAEEAAGCIAELDLVEHEIRTRVNVPASYMEELYNLRMHMARLAKRMSS